jgi:hypothetical protein
MRRTNLNTITIINDDATTVSAVGLILVEDFLLAKAAILTTTDIAIGTRPMAGNGLAVTTPEGIKRARAGTKATMVMMRRVRSGRPLEVLEGLAISVGRVWDWVSSSVLENALFVKVRCGPCGEDKEMGVQRRRLISRQHKPYHVAITTIYYTSYNGSLEAGTAGKQNSVLQWSAVVELCLDGVEILRATGARISCRLIG